MSGRNPLAFLGRQGARAIALSLVIGFVPNPLGPVLRSVLSETIFVLLVVAFLRVEPGRALHHARRPVLLALMVLWIMTLTPLATGLLADAAGLAPGLGLALVLMTASPPIMSAPAFAYLLGLDGALSLTLLVVCIVMTPLTAPLVAAAALPEALPLSAAALASRLFALLAGSAALAFLLRRLLGEARIAAAREELDGLNVVLLFIFAVALLDGMPARLAAAPDLVLGVAALSVAMSLVLIALTMALARRLPQAEALALSLAAGNRNMGLMLAALDARIPDLTFLYFALGQIPIYLLPLVLKPLAARLRTRPPS